MTTIKRLDIAWLLPVTASMLYIVGEVYPIFQLPSYVLFAAACDMTHRTYEADSAKYEVPRSALDYAIVFIMYYAYSQRDHQLPLGVIGFAVIHAFSIWYAYRFRAKKSIAMKLAELLKDMKALAAKAEKDPIDAMELKECQAIMHCSENASQRMRSL